MKPDDLHALQTLLLSHGPMGRATTQVQGDIHAHSTLLFNATTLPPQQGQASEGEMQVQAGPKPLSVQLLAVGEGPILRPGDEVLLRWEVSGGQPGYRQSIRIFLEDRLLESYTAHEDDRSFMFIVPEVRSEECRIEILTEDRLGASASSRSDRLVILGKPLAAKMLSPCAGERYQVGQQLDIGWSIEGGIAPYSSSVFLRINGSSHPIAKNLEDSFHCFTVPNHSTHEARIQVLVRDATGKQVSCLSDGCFTIEGFTVRVIHPNGRECVKAEEKVRITWEGIGPISRFDLQLIIGGEVVDQMAKDLPGDVLSLDWVVPYLPTEKAHIRVIAYDGRDRPMAQDDSDGSFTISKERPIRVTVLHPDGSAFGDQVFQLGDKVSISWKTEGRGVPARFKVSLVEVTEEGRHIFPIADDLPGTQDSCDWTIEGVPRTDTARILVEVVDQLGYSDCDDSDYYFKIH